MENVLIGNDGKLKLCDFGSSIVVEKDVEVNESNRYDVEQDIDSNTTPNYRAPE